MQYLKLLSPVLLLLIATSAEAIDGRDCLNQSTQLKMQERAAFLTACLARASSPPSVQEAARQAKARHCAENAKNLGLQVDEMMGHIKTCLIRNEAAEAAARMAATTKAPILASTTGTNSAPQ